MTTESEVILRDSPSSEEPDPDAQNTVTDFLDYTEYLPSDLNRSLTLIGKLDEFYLRAVESVHELSKDYGSLPTSSPKKGSAAQAQVLRQDISHELSYAVSCRESAYGEASRLYEMLDRHYHRLTSIISKLNALPKPPSRDPTPVPRSPQVARHAHTPRITLRLDSARHAANHEKSSPKPQRPRRSRKITVPGEVLPPPNPDSPLPFTDSEWESPPMSPLPMPTSRVGGSRKPARIRPPKPPKIPKLKAPKPPRPPRPPGAVGTNVHSSVAGISTSNALSLLTPPPEDAKAGSKYAPWMRLTEWEMAKLRKRMKKNAIWTPSETMIRRELSLAGRGPDAYRNASAQAEAAGEEILDDDDIANAAPGKPLLPGEISADSLGLAETNLENRGMKLNEAKKMKREVLAKERAAELASEAQKLGNVGAQFKELFSKPPDRLPAGLILTSPTKIRNISKQTSSPKDKPKEAGKTPAKKRKQDDTPKAELSLKLKEDLASVEKPSKKRRTEEYQSSPHPTVPAVPAQPPPSLAIKTQTVTTTIPLAAPAPSPKKSSRRSTPATPATPSMPAPEKPKPPPTPKSTATASRPRRVSLTIRGPAEPPPESIQTSPRITTTSIRAPSRRSSTGPPSATLPREQSRRGSVTPAPPTSPQQTVTAAGRRSKRPAPGVVVESQDGGAAISVGKRQHAPSKRIGPNARKAGHDANAKEKQEEPKEVAPLEEIDPNEPRYCLCGEVSYGEMVACENPNVS